MNNAPTYTKLQHMPKVGDRLGIMLIGGQPPCPATVVSIGAVPLGALPKGGIKFTVDIDGFGLCHGTFTPSFHQFYTI